MIRTKPWKQNLRVIPPIVKAKIEGFDTNVCIVACLVQIDVGRIKDGLYGHLGIRWQDGKLVCSEMVIPPAKIGRYSRYNRHGREIKRDDLPMVSKTWSIEVPNYGDWNRGSHEIDFTKPVYQRDHYAPKLVSMRIQHEGADLSIEAHIFRFVIEEVLDRRAGDFDYHLLFNLNLLQENVGNHDVFESDASVDDYLRTQYVNWEILPPGDKDDTLIRILMSTKSRDPRVREEIVDRYNFLQKLRPRNFIAGINEFRRYFGAQFTDDLVVFENLEYGNAIYVMFEDWKLMSQKSRMDLLSSATSNFVRIPHTKTWKMRLAHLINRERKESAGES